VWDLWAHQNGILHNSSIAQEEIVKSSVNQQIWAIYKARPQTLPCNSLHLLRPPQEAIVCLPLATKQQWVEWVTVAKKWKKKHDNGTYLVEQCFMEEWTNLH